MRRLVLDTNVWLDWLVFRDAGLAHLKLAIAERRAEVFIDAACSAELQRVLAYDLGRHRIDAAAQVAALAESRRVAQGIDVAAPDAERLRMPKCRDPDDQKFLDLALAARADVLVTKDHALLELARRVRPFRILPPAKLALG
jgi:putative PIN family toxin of toxin-antitoxin system